ncbi:HD domain-containing protein [uncultured Victivallis sp.]|uniref:HD domain-containing protein n=1 Tax=uncultured Victivallis sp. TaxID=354118 RepID=UPI00259161FE|nr:HD domain-containing protein [uncultured Victivallis sp.]
MEHLIDRINWRMMEFYSGEDSRQIAHTQCVHDYTRLLAAKSGVEPHRAMLLEIAAILHDIGCPAAREKYGDSRPPRQEEEGKRICRDWLPEYPELSCADIDYVAEVVGRHHRFSEAKRLEFIPLFEADLIVNLFEGYYPLDRAAELKEKLVTSVAGRELFDLLFLK